MNQSSARSSFRVLTRRRGGYGDGTMFDVQLQAVETGQLLWAQTFTDHAQATDFQRDIEYDLDELDGEAFRSKHRVPAAV